MRRTVAALALAGVLAGCSATPEPDITVRPPDPVPTSFVPAPTPTPSPTATPSATASPTPIPGTKLYPGPSPGTVLGEGDRPVRFVPADPAQSFDCRPLTEAERHQAALSDSGNRPVWSRRSAAVDLPEGFAVLAYWNRDYYSDKVETMGLVTGGGRFSNLYPGWRGSHTLAGVAFADGPKAFDAALACID